MMCLLDNVGAAPAGALARVSQITANYAVQGWRGDQATVLLHGRRSAAVGAAFANVWAVNGIDIDDGAQYAFGHAGVQDFPAALAVAEARELGGVRILAALDSNTGASRRAGSWNASSP